MEHRLEPVPLKDFPEHVAALHKDRDFGFEDEYSVCFTDCNMQAVLPNANSTITVHTILLHFSSTEH